MTRSRGIGRGMNNPLSTPEATARRFWSRVDKRADGCWNWTGAINSSGYGTFTASGKHVGAHRFSFELHAGGSISSDQHVLHRCDNPACVNPDHLRLGTHADNMRDMASKGRQWSQRKTHCVHGHEFTPENTLIASRGNGRMARICRTCSVARAKAWRTHQMRSLGKRKPVLA